MAEIGAPEPCLNGYCRSPIACNAFGYCRQRNFRMAEIGEPEKRRVLIPAKVTPPVEPVVVPNQPVPQEAPVKEDEPA